MSEEILNSNEFINFTGMLPKLDLFSPVNDRGHDKNM